MADTKKIIRPLDDLEMFELLKAAYPEKFKDESDETWEEAQQFAEDISGWEELAELLGRVVMLTMPMESGLTKRLSHCLGEVSAANGQAHMVAAVRRDADYLLAAREQESQSCPDCSGRGVVGGPSYSQPDEGGVVCDTCKGIGKAAQESQS